MRAIDEALVRQLHARARADRWPVPVARFAETLVASARKRFEGVEPTPADLEFYLSGLHLEDLALACACAEGDEAAWEHFVREFRPTLYRTADALDPSGGVRELADGLYADLFGLTERDGARQSLFRYFHGRSSLATWLRAVLSQRRIDRLRVARREDVLPEDDGPTPIRDRQSPPDPERDRDTEAMRGALERTIASLPPDDRLRLRCYYGQGLTLAAIGRLFGEHEGTASRHLTRIRRGVRDEVERRLRDEAGLSDAAIVRCVASVVADAGPLDLSALLGADEDEPGARKKSPAARSREEQAR